MVAPLIRRVLAPNPSHMTLQGTNTYLIGQAELAVIDPGPDMPEHLEAILREAGSAPIRAILVTHRHSDHLPAALPLAARSGAPLYGHADLPGVQRPLADGETIAVDDFHLRAVATPGHTPEHLCYLLEESQIVFSGDHVIGTGTVVVGDADGALIDYLASLRRLQALAPSRVLPGHGPAVEDPAAKVQEYLDHRQLRENQILAALAAGPRSVAELRAEIYPDLAAVLASAAENNVRTNLLKLRAERRALERESRWGLVQR